MERANYVAGLRAMADFYEQHPEVRVCEEVMGRDHVATNYFNSGTDEFKAAARALGSLEKKYDEKGTTITIRKEVAPGFFIAFEAPRDRICKKVTKIIPAHTVEVPEQTKEEWECESLLAEEEAAVA